MDFIALTQACAPQVAHETMAAIIKTESSFQPFAIGVNGGAKLVRQPKTKEEAIVTANWLIKNGYNIDLGLGQINSSNLPKINLSIEDAFEPCKNIAAAATILHSNYLIASRKTQGNQAALYAALSAYKTGSFAKGFSNGYVQKVINNAHTSTSIEPKITSPKTPLLNRKNKESVIKISVEKVEKTRSQISETNVYQAPTNNVMVY